MAWPGQDYQILSMHSHWDMREHLVGALPWVCGPDVLFQERTSTRKRVRETLRRPLWHIIALREPFLCFKEAMPKTACCPALQSY